MLIKCLLNHITDKKFKIQKRKKKNIHFSHLYLKITVSTVSEE